MTSSSVHSLRSALQEQPVSSVSSAHQVRCNPCHHKQAPNGLVECCLGCLLRWVIYRQQIPSPGVGVKHGIGAIKESYSGDMALIVEALLTVSEPSKYCAFAGIWLQGMIDVLLRGGREKCFLYITIGWAAADLLLVQLDTSGYSITFQSLKLDWDIYSSLL